MRLFRKGHASDTTRANYQKRAIPDCSKIMEYGEAYGYLEYRRPASIHLPISSCFGMGNDKSHKWTVRFCVLHQNTLYIYTDTHAKSPDPLNQSINLAAARQFSTKVYPSGSLKLSKAVLSITSKKKVRHQFSCSPSFNCSYVWFDIFKKALQLSAVKPKPFDNLLGKTLSHKGCHHSASPCSDGESSAQRSCPLRICPTSLGMQTDTRTVPWTSIDEEEICMTLYHMAKGHQYASMPNLDAKREYIACQKNDLPKRPVPVEIVDVAETASNGASAETYFSSQSSLGDQCCMQGVVIEEIHDSYAVDDSDIDAEERRVALSIEETPFLSELREAVAERRDRLDHSQILQRLDDSVREKHLNSLLSVDEDECTFGSKWLGCSSESIVESLREALIHRRKMVAGDSPSDASSTLVDADACTDEWQ